MPDKHRAALATTRSSKASVQDEIAHLRDLDLKALCARWQSVFPATAASSLAEASAVCGPGFSNQADRYSDLDHETRKVLDRTGANESGSAMADRLQGLVRKRTDLTPGTVLVREWDRKSHRVMVLADGFAWNGPQQRITLHP